MTPSDASTAAVAREIAPDVYCLGPKGRTQTNVYFVRAGSSWVLIDAGWTKDGPAIRQAAEAVFGTGTRPAAILLTHVHPDHDGSALELARAWEVPVYVHPEELPQANGDFAAISAGGGPLDIWLILPLMRAMGRRRREEMLAKSSLRDVARAFEPGSAVPGLPGWECLPTPGHTPGHVSFFRPSDHTLIAGDALVTMQLNSILGLLLLRQGLSGPPWYTSWNWRMAKASVAALARLEPRVLAGGHGMPLTGAGTGDALGAFADRFSGPAPRPRSPFVAGMLGGVVAVVVTGVLMACLVGCLGPRVMPRLMKRMIRDGGSDAMRACMERCGRRPASSDDASAGRLAVPPS